MEQIVFDEFRRVVRRETGISLGPHKEALVAARVARRMRALGVASHRGYLKRVASDPSGEETTQLIDAMCTNVTSFFREEDHFCFLRDTAAQWKAEGRTRIRIWSAACSTGEEPYSLALTMRDALEADRDIDVRILGTDISTKALKRAMAGTYESKRVSPIGPEALAQYFVQGEEQGTASWTAGPQLKELVVFRQLNLADPPFPFKGDLDLIMCRNVMIYFDHDLRKRLVAEFERLLRPGGYLMVGHAETLAGQSRGLKYVRPATYMKR